MLWSVYPHNRGPPGRARATCSAGSVPERGSLDDALMEFAEVPLTFEVRGTRVTLDEFRRLAAEEPSATGSFVARSMNGQKLIDSALV